MTIDEVLKRVKEKMACFYHISGCDTCDISSCEDRDIIIQLSECLEELKNYRDKNKLVVRIDVENMDSIKDKIEELSKYAESQYNKGVDDFAEWLVKQGILDNRVISNGEITDYGKVYAKKFKEKKNDD